MKDILPLNENDNVGGVETIEFALVSDIASIPDVVEMKVPTGIIMNTGKRFYKAPVTLESTLFADTATDSEHGKSYEKSITGFCPCDCNENAAQFDEMENARFVVIVKDNNGVKRIVGTIAEPLQFSIGRSTAQSTSETPGINLSFYGKGLQQSPFYDL